MDKVKLSKVTNFRSPPKVSDKIFSTNHLKVLVTLTSVPSFGGLFNNQSTSEFLQTQQS
ncbi:MAG: hypothetical protein ACTS4Y_00605 [Candidatus Hodgkinia cicadicola]